MFKYTTNEIRKTFLNFFSKNAHIVLPSSSLVPENDDSILFTNSGMVQFKNYFLGKEADFTCVTTSQKCMRAGGKHNDLENVGRTARHHTFFEMLGNFSFGSYFKEEAIELAWKLLTQVFNLDKNRLYITVFYQDDESYNIWRKITNLSDDKIIRIDGEDNFWSMGNLGPCGPCTEIFYDHGDKYQGGLPGSGNDGDRYVEIWNIVFMQYEKLPDKLIKLPRLCVDTGMGIERLAAVLQNVNNNFDTDVFIKIIKASQNFTKDKTNITAHQIIADHLRASCFLIADGITPGSEGRGYVLRRILRRAIRQVNILSYDEGLLHKLVPVLLDEMGTAYPELKRAEVVISMILEQEEKRFLETLEKGIKLLNSYTEKLSSNLVLNGDIAFKLYDTYGFPLDLTKEILSNTKITIDEEGFNKAMDEQKSRAKHSWINLGPQKNNLGFQLEQNFKSTEFIGYHTESAEVKIIAIIFQNQLVEQAMSGDNVILIFNKTPFYPESGGQVGDIGTIGAHIVTDTIIYFNKLIGHNVLLQSELRLNSYLEAKIDVENRKKIKSNHSATHILHYTLQKVLGNHVTQKGSLVNAEKLRFDFSHFEPLTLVQKQLIELEVNKNIRNNNEISAKLMSYDSALEIGAMALFGEKYQDEVRVISMDQSRELCGGTHVRRTGDIGMFKIIHEEGISSGVRRIEALTGENAITYTHELEEIVNKTTNLMKCSKYEVINYITVNLEDNKKLLRKINKLNIQVALTNRPEIKIIKIYNIKVNLVIQYLLNEEIPQSSIKDISLRIGNFNELNIFIYFYKVTSPAHLVIYIDPKTKINIDRYQVSDIKFNAKVIALNLMKRFGGKGGGNEEIAQVREVNLTEELSAFIENLYNKVL